MSIWGTVLSLITICCVIWRIGSRCSQPHSWWDLTRSFSKLMLRLQKLNKKIWTLRLHSAPWHWQSTRKMKCQRFWQSMTFTRQSYRSLTTSKSKCSYWIKRMKSALWKTILSSSKNSTIQWLKSTSATASKLTKRLANLKLSKQTGPRRN